MCNLEDFLGVNMVRKLPWYHFLYTCFVKYQCLAFKIVHVVFLELLFVAKGSLVIKATYSGYFNLHVSLLE